MITTYNFNLTTAHELTNQSIGSDWPVVYLLENGTEMYVGETISAATRFKQHLANLNRARLTIAHIITDAEFNKSATLDMESWLIQYMAADGKFKLLNGNAGMVNHNYYERLRYKSKFELLWRELKTTGVAFHDLLELQNSDIFKYSPYKALTSEQLKIVKNIESCLIQGQSSHIIYGSAGTGKSVLATYLVKYLLANKDTEQMKIALVVPQVGLRATLKKVFKTVQGLSPNMVLGPSEVIGKTYDLLIVDEAHRLKRRVNITNFAQFDQANLFYRLGHTGTQLDWVLMAGKSHVLMYDPAQSVLPSDIRPEQLLIPNVHRHYLTGQLRALAGNDYIDYVCQLLNGTQTTEANFGEYELAYYPHLLDMMDDIKKRDRTFGLARLVAGYAWPWLTRKGADHDIAVDGQRLKWNSTTLNWVHSKNAINEVGCIHTVQGYDLNYVGVIIGPEFGYDPVRKKLITHKERYKDFNGKRSIQSPEELHIYITNIYKTLLTRGIRGTFIHAVDPELARYLSKLMPVRVS